jgi:hypothetical protein
MNTKTQMILLGGAAASAWWAGAMFEPARLVCTLAAICLSLIAALVMVFESEGD